MQDFRKLEVWHRAMALTESVYLATDSFPSHERFGLQTQMRRAAVSIPSNVAEGCGRSAQRDFARFLRIANGSACELETHIRIALSVGIGDDGLLGSALVECEQIRRMLSALTQRVIDHS